MMPRFLWNTQTQTLILSLCLNLSFSLPLWAQAVPLPQPPGTVLVQQLLQDMQAGEPRTARYGFPFWLDSRWIKDEQTLSALFQEGAKQRPFPEVTHLRVEIHPLSTLEAKSPAAWERLSLKSEAEFLAKTRLALVFFEIKKHGELHREESWLLVQPTEGSEPLWKLVGLLER